MTGRSRAGRDALVAVAVVLAALAVRVSYGLAKADFHVDEGITLAITNGTWNGPSGFAVFERWIDKAELDEVVFNGNLREAGRIDFAGIAEITANDVHPPLFYWLYAIARRAVGVDRFVWAGLLLNGACFVLTAILLAATLRRAVASRRLALLALALFAFSPAAVSLTRFIRMYELLQLACAAFLCCACHAVIPRKDGTHGLSRHLAIAGLFVSSCLGLLTHYYFLLLVIPVSLVSALVLARRKDAATLLWCVLAVLVGLYAAWRVFPAMESHVFRSSRAAQSAANVLGYGVGGRLGRVGAFALIACRYMPAIPAGAACCLYALYRASRAWRRSPRGGSKGAIGDEVAEAGDSRAAISPAFLAIVAVASAFTFLAIALSAPYMSLRYIVAFTPLYTTLGACAAARVLPERTGTIALLAVLALGIVPGLLPPNVANFHEDYVVDLDPSRLRDGTPVIIVSDLRGHSWKNLLPYACLGRDKRVYVTVRDQGFGGMDSLGSIADRSGSAETYAIVDALLPQPDGLEPIGRLGFFAVYRIKAE